MRPIVVDTSALICILLDESEALEFAHTIVERDPCAISAASVLEAHSIVLRRRIPAGVSRIGGLIVNLGLHVVTFDRQQLATSITAYQLYGRGTGHPARLNMGDCFSYALAKTRNLPLLFKGDDFVHTDITSALAAQ